MFRIAQHSSAGRTLAALAITSFGVGASTAVSHSLGGITYRTFTAPMARVKTASVGALGRMGINLAGTEKNGEVHVPSYWFMAAMAWT